MIVDLVMIGLLWYQIWMPAVDNAKYTFQIDRDGTVIRMNTQDGTMMRCSQDLKCDPDTNNPPQELDYKY